LTEFLQSRVEHHCPHYPNLAESRSLLRDPFFIFPRRKRRVPFSVVCARNAITSPFQGLFARFERRPISCFLALSPFHQLCFRPATQTWPFDEGPVSPFLVANDKTPTVITFSFLSRFARFKRQPRSFFSVLSLFPESLPWPAAQSRPFDEGPVSLFRH